VSPPGWCYPLVPPPLPSSDVTDDYQFFLADYYYKELLPIACYKLIRVVNQNKKVKIIERRAVWAD